jgi:hypothetical protein
MYVRDSLFVPIKTVLIEYLHLFLQVVTDPHTGQQKTKHKMGGSYPGNRRTPNKAYTPNASEFNSQGQATAHFINYGGGNALVLQQGGMAQPVVGKKKPSFVQGE